MAETTLIESMEEVAREGLAVLRDALRARTRDDAELKLARIASTSFAAYTRMLQVQSAREATMVTMMTHSSETAEEFRRLVSASLPGTPIAAALTNGTERSRASRSGAKPSQAERS
jgi:hypothetical protein